VAGGVAGYAGPELSDSPPLTGWALGATVSFVDVRGYRDRKGTEKVTTEKDRKGDSSKWDIS